MLILTETSSPAVVLLLFCFQTMILYGQTTKQQSNDVEARITEVENSLIRRVETEGMPFAQWTSADRMKFYRKWICIAVIKVYKIEGA